MPCACELGQGSRHPTTPPSTYLESQATLCEQLHPTAGLHEVTLIGQSHRIQDQSRTAGLVSHNVGSDIYVLATWLGGKGNQKTGAKITHPVWGPFF